VSTFRFDEHRVASYGRSLVVGLLIAVVAALAAHADLASAAASEEVVSADGLRASTPASSEPRMRADSQVQDAPAVSNEAGDVLEITGAHPSSATSTESGYKVACSAGTATPYRGSLYSVCGEIYAYDANRGSSEVPPTNESEETIWDACGTQVGNSRAIEWHTKGYVDLKTPAAKKSPPSATAPTAP
jgi:hypothetical protein